jgi:hypothetical protein
MLFLFILPSHDLIIAPSMVFPSGDAIFLSSIKSNTPKSNQRFSSLRSQSLSFQSLPKPAADEPFPPTGPTDGPQTWPVPGTIDRTSRHGSASACRVPVQSCPSPSAASCHATVHTAWGRHWKTPKCIHVHPGPGMPQSLRLHQTIAQSQDQLPAASPGGAPNRWTHP